MSQPGTVLITGSTGFIGRNLVERLGVRYQILSPNHTDLDLLDEDAVCRFLANHPVEAVIHCATKPGHRNAPDPTGLIYPNTRMFFNLVRALDPAAKFLLINTGAVYDSRYFHHRMQETFFDVHVPIDETGYSKYLCAKHVELRPNSLELRPFGVFGKYEDWEIRFISNAICKTLYDMPITIKRNRRMDYVFIDDFSRIVEHFLEIEPNYQTYNVTTDDSYELVDLAHQVREISGKHLPIRVAAEGYSDEYTGDNGRLHSQIPDLDFTPMTTAISELYGWYSERKHLIDPTRLVVDK